MDQGLVLVLVLSVTEVPSIQHHVISLLVYYRQLPLLHSRLGSMNMSDAPFLSVFGGLPEELLKTGNTHDSNADRHWNSRTKWRFKYYWTCSCFQLILLFTNLIFFILNSEIASMSPSIKASQIINSPQQAYLCKFTSSWQCTDNAY